MEALLHKSPRLQPKQKNQNPPKAFPSVSLFVFDKQASATACAALLRRHLLPAAVGVWAEETAAGGQRRYFCGSLRALIAAGAAAARRAESARQQQSRLLAAANAKFDDACTSTSSDTNCATPSSSTMCNLYEVLEAGQPVWLYFDVEYLFSFNPQQRSSAAIAETWRQLLLQLRGFLCNACGMCCRPDEFVSLDATTHKKFSRHLIVKALRPLCEGGPSTQPFPYPEYAEKHPSMWLLRDDCDITSTGADITSTGADITSTGADITSTGADITSTGADITSTGADTTSTGADTTSTGADTTSTEAAGNFEAAEGPHSCAGKGFCSKACLRVSRTEEGSEATAAQETGTEAAGESAPTPAARGSEKGQSTLMADAQTAGRFAEFFVLHLAKRIHLLQLQQQRQEEIQTQAVVQSHPTSGLLPKPQGYVREQQQGSSANEQLAVAAQLGSLQEEAEGGHKSCSCATEAASASLSELMLLFPFATEDGGRRCLVDLAVYTRNRCFRLLGASKFKQNTPLRVSEDCSYPLGTSLELQILRSLVGLVPPGIDIPLFHHTAIAPHPSASAAISGSSNTREKHLGSPAALDSSASLVGCRLLPVRPFLATHTHGGFFSPKVSSARTEAAAPRDIRDALLREDAHSLGLPSHVTGLRDAAAFAVAFWQRPQKHWP
ncbi:hypothetical protein cyc_06589 [Cyclospora cayetanensis]|uniref:DNA-directed primase/polymerase protein n=1 Tax=Cyclospora cayetanensis TaxID=88456 RepID=A0A1D3CTG4_9EIME|nr:hypothetical protein cyc_06589 [Cyclospora cayetanensis]